MHRLTTEDLQSSIRLAQDRSNYCIQHGIKSVDGGPDDPDESLKVHIIGAAGETASSRVCQLRHNMTIGTFKRIPDIGNFTEVRTRSKFYQDLYIEQSDPLDRIYVLAMLWPDAEQIKIWGWIWGNEAPEICLGIKTVLRDPNNPVWLIPKSSLHLTRPPDPGVFGTVLKQP